MILEILAILFYGIGDLATTIYLVKKAGINVESNPLIKYMIEKFGFGSMIMIKLGVFIWIFYFIPQDTIFLVILGGLGTIWNINTITKYEKFRKEREGIKWMCRY